MAGRKRQIIALGGGGFSMEPDNPALDLYVLRQARATRPVVAFLATASGDAEAYLVKFYAAFSGHDCRPSHLPFFQRTPRLRDYLLRQDIIYVGGGNTKSMLAVWRAWDLPGLLREAWEAGAVLAGLARGRFAGFSTALRTRTRTGSSSWKVSDSWRGAAAPTMTASANAGRPTMTSS
jgi:dipeptidase E